MPVVLIPVPARDFDPTEVAISWLSLRTRGITVEFATPDGEPAVGDEIMLTGEGLDPWGRIPGLKKFPLLGLFLRASREARKAYGEMLGDPNFLHPYRYDTLDPDRFDGLLLPGGHRARGMRDYLESLTLQRFVSAFFETGKPVGAICHGVVLAARSTHSANGRSVLYGRQTTGLTWALEGRAWRSTRFWGRFWDPHYYRTYLEGPGEPEGHRSVEAEIKRALASDGDFKDVPKNASDYRRKVSGMFRDSETDERPAFVVVDGHYVSARWPGDAHTFARRFARLLAS